MREKLIETKLCKAVHIRGGLCLKFVSPSYNGVPDRIILLPGGKLAFVETKASGKTLRPLQKRRKRQLEELGIKVFSLNDERMTEGILDEIQSL